MDEIPSQDVTINKGNSLKKILPHIFFWSGIILFILIYSRIFFYPSITPNSSIEEFKGKYQPVKMSYYFESLSSEIDQGKQTYQIAGWYKFNNTSDESQQWIILRNQNNQIIGLGGTKYAKVATVKTDSNNQIKFEVSIQKYSISPGFYQIGFLDVSKNSVGYYCLSDKYLYISPNDIQFISQKKSNANSKHKSHYTVVAKD